MACNCGTQEEIDKLYKAYGDKMALAQAKGTDSFFGKIKYYAYQVLTILAWVVAFPVMLFYVLAVVFWKEKPSINIQSINLLRIFHLK